MNPKSIETNSTPWSRIELHRTQTHRILLDQIHSMNPINELDWVRRSKKSDPSKLDNNRIGSNSKRENQTATSSVQSYQIIEAGSDILSGTWSSARQCHCVPLLSNSAFGLEVISRQETVKVTPSTSRIADQFRIWSCKWQRQQRLARPLPRPSCPANTKQVWWGRFCQRKWVVKRDATLNIRFLAPPEACGNASIPPPSIPVREASLSSEERLQCRHWDLYSQEAAISPEVVLLQWITWHFLNVFVVVTSAHQRVFLQVQQLHPPTAALGAQRDSQVVVWLQRSREKLSHHLHWLRRLRQCSFTVVKKIVEFRHVLVHTEINKCSHAESVTPKFYVWFGVSSIWLDHNFATMPWTIRIDAHLCGVLLEACWMPRTQNAKLKPHRGYSALEKNSEANTVARPKFDTESFPNAVVPEGVDDLILREGEECIGQMGMSTFCGRTQHAICQAVCKDGEGPPVRGDRGDEHGSQRSSSMWKQSRNVEEDRRCQQTFSESSTVRRCSVAKSGDVGRRWLSDGGHELSSVSLLLLGQTSGRWVFFVFVVGSAVCLVIWATQPVAASRSLPKKKTSCNSCENL